MKILLEVISLIGIVIGFLNYQVSDILTGDISSLVGGMGVLIFYPSLIVFIYLRFFRNND